LFVKAEEKLGYYTANQQRNQFFSLPALIIISLFRRDAQKHPSSTCEYPHHAENADISKRTNLSGKQKIMPNYLQLFEKLL